MLTDVFPNRKKADVALILVISHLLQMRLYLHTRPNVQYICKHFVWKKWSILSKICKVRKYSHPFGATNPKVWSDSDIQENIREYRVGLSCWSRRKHFNGSKKSFASGMYQRKLDRFFSDPYPSSFDFVSRFIYYHSKKGGKNQLQGKRPRAKKAAKAALWSCKQPLIHWTWYIFPFEQFRPSSNRSFASDVFSRFHVWYSNWTPHQSSGHATLDHCKVRMSVIKTLLGWGK